MLIIGVTGHRPPALGNLWHPRQWAPAVEFFRDYFAMMSGSGPITVVSGMAQGADLIFAAGALAAKKTGAPVELVAAVPYPAQRATIKIALAQAWYDAALAKAERVVYVSERDPVGSGEANSMLRARNEWVVEHTERVWAIWDGRCSGGTYNTVLHARLHGREVDNHWTAVARVLDLSPRHPRSASWFDPGPRVKLERPDPTARKRAQ